MFIDIYSHMNVAHISTGPRTFCTRNKEARYNVGITGYKIKDDRKFLGIFIMSFNALGTYIFKYYHLYYSVQLTENAINPLFIIYFTS